MTYTGKRFRSIWKKKLLGDHFNWKEVVPETNLVFMDENQSTVNQGTWLIVWVDLFDNSFS